MVSKSDVILVLWLKYTQTTKTDSEGCSYVCVLHVYVYMYMYMYIYAYVIYVCKNNEKMILLTLE